MSEIEIKQMQEKINAGILLARKRLIEKVKKKMANWSLSGMEKSSASKPRTSNNTAYTKAAIISSAIRSRIFTCIRNAKEHRNRKAENIPAFLFSLYTTATIRRTHIYNRLSRRRDIRPRY